VDAYAKTQNHLKILQKCHKTTEYHKYTKIEIQAKWGRGLNI